MVARVRVRIPERERETSVLRYIVERLGDAVNGRIVAAKHGPGEFVFDPAGTPPVSDFDAIGRAALLDWRAIAAWADAYDARVAAANDGDGTVDPDDFDCHAEDDTVGDLEDDVTDVQADLDGFRRDLEDLRAHTDATPDEIAEAEDRVRGAEDSLREVTAERDAAKAKVEAAAAAAAAYGEVRRAAATTLARILADTVSAASGDLVRAYLDIAFLGQPDYADIDTDEYLSTVDKWRTLAEVVTAVRNACGIDEEDEDGEPIDDPASVVASNMVKAQATVFAEIRRANGGTLPVEQPAPPPAPAKPKRGRKTKAATT